MRRPPAAVSASDIPRCRPLCGGNPGHGADGGPGRIGLNESLPPWADAMAREITSFGKSGWILTGSAIIAGLGWIASRNSVQTVSRALFNRIAIESAGLFVAVAGSGLTANLAKRIIGRPRPPQFDEAGLGACTPSPAQASRVFPPAIPPRPVRPSLSRPHLAEMDRAADPCRRLRGSQRVLLSAITLRCRGRVRLRDLLFVVAEKRHDPARIPGRLTIPGPCGDKKTGTKQGVVRVLGDCAFRGVEWQSGLAAGAGRALSGSPAEGTSGVGVDVVVLGFAQEDHADHEGDAGDDDRVPEAVIDVALGSAECEDDGGSRPPNQPLPM